MKSHRLRENTVVVINIHNKEDCSSFVAFICANKLRDILRHAPLEGVGERRIGLVI